MGYAPISRVAVAPDPADSGSTLRVTADTGPIFPGIPFVALCWPEGEIPHAGVNAEQLQVIGRTLDQMQLVRTDPLEIRAGWMFAAIETIPNYERGDEVTLKGHFAEDSQPYLVHVRSPLGEQDTYGSQHGVTHDSAGNAEYAFTPDRSGLWAFRWEGGDGSMLEDNAFFVNHSTAL